MLVKKRNIFPNFIFFIILVSFYCCETLKRVPDDSLLIIKNSVFVDSSLTRNEKLDKIVLQKPNDKILGYPLRLHIYNSAREEIDSVLNQKYFNPEKPKDGLKNFLSVKQYNNHVLFKKNYNSWIKKSGQAPVILDSSKTNKSKTIFHNYFFSTGWFDNEINYEVKYKNKKAEVQYFISRKQPYLLDSIKYSVNSEKLNQLISSTKQKSYLKKDKQFNKSNIIKERERISNLFKNSGVYFFDEQYISFQFDTLDLDHKVKTDIIIKDNVIKTKDSSFSKPFEVYNINKVNVIIDDPKADRLQKPDTLNYKNITFYYFNKLKYKPRILYNSIFFKKDSLYREIERVNTYKYISQLNSFKYPNISFEANKENKTLKSNIHLVPKKKFDYNVGFDVTQSNIQTLGLEFNTGINARNIFRGAETLNFSIIGSIGSSKDAASSNYDQFFDITEFGGNLNLTIPRFFTPFNTSRFASKNMNPKTKISISSTSQRNIGLDKRTLNTVLNYNWNPKKNNSRSFDLMNIQFVNNLNPDNYFGVYTTSYKELNEIAQDIKYITEDKNLSYPNETDQFTNDVLNGNTELTPRDNDYKSVNSIEEKRKRLTDNNLIISSIFSSSLKKEKPFSKDMFLFRYKIELAGNLFNLLEKPLNLSKNSENQYMVFNVPYSQFVKTEFDFIKYWDLGYDNIFAFRWFSGIAIPYENSNYIPFVKSYFAGGPNDNRAWSAYSLGPGKSNSINEFNEANLKLHFSLEHRFNLLGNLYSAIFTDFGNIWNVFDNVTDKSYTFNGIESLKDLAVGSGFGLRYDFEYFVFRGDIGFKTYEPYLENRKWFRNYNFSNAVFNIGINYPF